MGEKGISRRSFLKWSAGALASVALLEFERPARAFAAEAAPSQRFPPRPSRSRGSRRSSRRTWQSSMPMRRASKRAVCAQRYRACSRIYLPRHARVRRRRAGMRAQPSGQRERRGGRRALAAGGGILAGKDAVALGLLTAEGKLVAPIGAEGFLVHLGDHDWVLSGFAAARCVAYLRDYAKRSFGTLPEARFNALRNYVGSRVSYMRLYQAIAQGGADALMASVVKAQACLRRAAGKMREAWRERAPTPAAVGFAFHRRRMVDLVAPAGKIKARQASARMIW